MTFLSNKGPRMSRQRVGKAAVAGGAELLIAGRQVLPWGSPHPERELVLVCLAETGPCRAASQSPGRGTKEETGGK